MNAIVQKSVHATVIPHRPVLNVAVIGPAGHGKSAIIGRLLAETGTVNGALRIPAHEVLLIDDPDQSELLRDSVAGFTQTDAAVLVVDSSEREPSLLYGQLFKLLGLRQVVVVVSKLDRINYDASRVREIETAITDDLKSFGLAPVDVIAVSALDGEGLTKQAYTAEWYRPTLVEALDRLSPASVMSESRHSATAASRLDDH